MAPLIGLHAVVARITSQTFLRNLSQSICAYNVDRWGTFQILELGAGGVQLALRKWLVSQRMECHEPLVVIARYSIRVFLDVQFSCGQASYMCNLSDVFSGVGA